MLSCLYFYVQQIRPINILINIWLGCEAKALAPELVPKPQAIAVKTMFTILAFK